MKIIILFALGVCYLWEASAIDCGDNLNKELPTDGTLQIGADIQVSKNKDKAKEECCAKCKDSFDNAASDAERCFVWAVGPKQGQNRPCRLYKETTDFTGGNNNWRSYYYAIDKGGSTPEICGCDAHATGDPHFLTFDGLPTSIREQPMFDTFNASKRAEYLLMRTVACNKKKPVPPQRGILNYPAMSMTYTVEPSFKHKQLPGIRSVTLLVDYTKVFGKGAKRYEITLLKEAHAIHASLKTSAGRPVNVTQPTTVCGADDKCGENDINIYFGGHDHTHRHAIIEMKQLGFKVEFTYKMRRVDVSLGSSSALGSLEGNLCGILGNNNGNRGDDGYCPEAKDKPEHYGTCWMMTPGRALFPLEFAKGSSFYKCPEINQRPKEWLLQAKTK